MTLLLLLPLPLPYHYHYYYHLRTTTSYLLSATCPALGLLPFAYTRREAQLKTQLETSTIPDPDTKKESKNQLTLN